MHVRKIAPFRRFCNTLFVAYYVIHSTSYTVSYRTYYNRASSPAAGGQRSCEVWDCGMSRRWRSGWEHTPPGGTAAACMRLISAVLGAQQRCVALRRRRGGRGQHFAGPLHRPYARANIASNPYWTVAHPQHRWSRGCGDLHVPVCVSKRRYILTRKPLPALRFGAAQE